VLLPPNTYHKQPNNWTWTAKEVDNRTHPSKPQHGATWQIRNRQNRYTPNSVPFNTVLNACARARNVPRAEQWLNTMQEAGIKPDRVSYNVMIKAHSIRGDVAGADRWFAEMLVGDVTLCLLCSP
jgi:pentatricopeptide repeat protein